MTTFYSKSYPSKVLLYGEYTIIEQGAALAIPYPTLAGRWQRLSSNNSIATASHQSLLVILSFLQKSTLDFLNLDAFAIDLEQGIWFDSNIPGGYGLGSSGAVCAAIYDRYCLQKTTNWQELQSKLAAIENCFHGRSSGIDPLVSYLQQPLLITADGDIQQVDLPLANTPTGGGLFLLDTQLERQATAFINFFVNAAKQSDFQKSYIAPAKQAAQQAIAALIEPQPSQLLTATKQLSALQYQHLSPMVPEHFSHIWEQGLDTQAYSIKLCGAGGGGFLLGATADWEATKNKYLKNNNVTLIYSW